MKLNKENLLDYYNMKETSIEEKINTSESKDETIGWQNQLNLIKGLILELDLFD